MNAEFLQRKYSREDWQKFLPQLLSGVELFSQPHDFPLTSERERAIATARRQFGSATLADGKRIAFYEIDVAPTKVDLLRNRVALRELIARCIDEVSAHAVLAFFVQSGNNAYRLTYAAKESKLGEDLEIHTEQTATRRFTYVLGPGETRRTAALRLAGLAADHAGAKLADVTDAFSVEKLNKEFFDTYKQHYQKFCGHLLDDADTTTKIFGLKLRGLDDKARDHALKPVRDFVKKLLGRLVFLHFLQKKGWLGCPATAKNWKNGDQNFIRQLFDTAPEADRKRFHSRRLVPLFFDTLNRERKDDLFAVNGTRVPYLNGGLFERDFDGVEQIDFPPELFANLLNFFGQYNFTIDENDPDDHEIGIDPEMLGHIFENLLEDNKDKGAYYTPKAVVQYMCQQSLIHALAGHFPDDSAARAEIENLIRHKEPIDPKQEKSWLATNAHALEKILDDLNICDPAIGSGAFPIGLLQEIYWTKLTLHPALDRAEAKRAIIQRSIHGVDIDAGAVEIARLRFWLALIVEEKNPVPLPNLDYQIMQGNSLLESFEGLDLSKISEPQRIGVTLLGNDQVELGLARPVELTVGSEPQEKLDALQRKYFACHDPEKKARLRAQIDAAILRAIDYELELRRETLAATLENWRRDLARRQKLKKDYEPTAKELKTRDTMQAELDALADKKAKLHTLLENPRAERPFFLWHLWFRNILQQPPVGRGGFDIVIGNPPYGAAIDAKTLSWIVENVKDTKNTNSAALFIDAARNRLIHERGVLSLIVPKSLLYSEKWLSLAMSLHTRTVALVDVEQAFSNVLLEQVLFVYANSQTFTNYIAQKFLGNEFKRLTKIPSDTLEQFRAWICDVSELELALGMKISKSGRFLRDVTESTRGLPVQRSLKAQGDIQVIGGKNISRYGVSGEKGFIALDNSFLGSEKHKSLLRPKIISQQIIAHVQKPEPHILIVAAVDQTGEMLGLDTVENTFVTDNSIHLNIVAALFNSALVNWYAYRFIFCGAVRTMHFDEYYIGKIPLPNFSENDQRPIIELVDRILVAKRAGNKVMVQQLEQEIDTHVFRLYGLTQEEIALVQAAQPAKKLPVIAERTLPTGKRTTLGGVKYAIQLVQSLLTESAGGLTWPRLVDAFTLATQPNLMAQETASADAAKVKAWSRRWNEALPPGALITAIEQLGALNLAVKKSGNTWHIRLKTEPPKSAAEDVNYDAWLALRVLGPAPEVQLATPVFAAPQFAEWTNMIEALAA